MTIRVKITLLVAGLVLATSSFAADRGQSKGRMNQRVGPEVAGQILEHIKGAMRRLDLNEDQQAAIHEEFAGFKESAKPLIRELHEGRKALFKAISSDQYDANLVAEIAAQQGELTAEITVIAGGAAAAVLAQLSEQQRLELKSMAEERRTFRAEHHKLRKQQINKRRDSRDQEGGENS